MGINLPLKFKHEGLAYKVSEHPIQDPLESGAVLTKRFLLEADNHKVEGGDHSTFEVGQFTMPLVGYMKKVGPEKWEDPRDLTDQDVIDYARDYLL